MMLGFVAAPLSAQTDCSAITISDENSWFEDFEGYIGSGEQPFQCWIPLVSDVSYNGPFVYCGWANSCHSGTNSAEMKGASNLLILPEFTNDVTDLRLSFWATATSVSIGTLEVGIITDTTDASTFVSMFTCGAPGPRGSSGSAGNGNYMGPFDFNSATVTGRIALRYTSTNASQSWNLDDFTVELIPACAEPSGLVLSSATATSADITWNELDGETYNLVYWTGTDTTIVQNASLTNGTYTINNLTPNTLYYFLIQLNCTIDNSVINSFNTVSFKTPNLPITLPYEQNFEIDPDSISDFTLESSYPNAWIIGSGTYVPNEEDPTVEGHALHISNDGINYAYTGTDYSFGYSYAVLDMEFPDDNLEWHLSFDYKSDGSEYYTNFYGTQYCDALSVFLVDASTDIPTDAFPNGTMLMDAAMHVISWTPFDVILPYVSGQAKRIMFVWKTYAGTGANIPAAIDNIHIYGNACAQPMGLAVTNVTDESISISWDEVGSATNWNVYIKETNGEGDYDVTAVIDTFYTFSDLNPNVSYSIYVTSNCGSEESAPTPTIIQKTTNLPIPIPYNQNFETNPESISDFTLEAAHVNSWVIGNATYMPDEDDPTATGHALYISNNNNSYAYSNSDAYDHLWYSYAVLDMQFPDEDLEWHLTFDYKCEGYDYYGYAFYSDFFSAYLVDGSTEIPTEGNPEGVALLENVLGVNSWTEFDAILPNVSGTSKRIMFVWKNVNNSNGTNAPAAIDNVRIYGNACAQPANLAVSNITNNEATLSWNEVGSATAWTVYYKTNNEDTYQSVTATNTSITITNLNADTHYEFYVTADCDGTESNASPHFFFKTDCGALTGLPYTANFDEYIIMPNGDEYIDCWSRLSSDPSHQVYHMGSTTYSHDGSAGCLDFAYTPGCWTTAIMPAFDESIPVNTLMLQFWLVKTGNSGYFEVGVMSDPTDSTTFEVVDTIYNTLVGNNAESYELHYVSLSSYNGLGQYIAFRVSNAVSCGYRLDDVSVTLIPDCMHPSNLHVTGTTETSVSLGWTEMGDALSWVVAYVPHGGNIEDAVEVPVTNNPCTISGLVGGTVYDFYVKSGCNSEWAEPITAAAGQYIMGVQGSDTLTTCAAVIYDDGGFYNSYSSNCSYNLVIYPATEGNGLAINGLINSYNSIYLSYTGILTIYGGVGTNGTVLGSFQGYQQVSVEYGGPVTLRFESGEYSGTNFPAPGFEMHVSCISCYPPADLTASNIGMTSATISWSGDADSYTIEYGEAGFTPGEGTTVTVFSTSYDITDLEAGNDYTVYVTTTCTDAVSSPAVVNFSTPICDVADQCAYTFILTDSYGDGWNGGSLDVQQNGVTVATLGMSTGSYVTQTVTLCNNFSTSLVWTAGSYVGEVGFSVLAPDETEIYTINGMYDYTTYTFTASCTMPTCPKPADITVSNIGATTAEVSWTSAGTETAWNLEYKVSTDATWTVIPVTTNPYTLNVLTAFTDYDVRVQADCGGGDVSDYRETSFSTAGCEVADQCDYTFILSDSYGDGWNGGTLQVQQNGIIVTTVEMTSGSSATRTVTLCDNVSTSLIWSSGYYDDEVGFTVTDPNGNEVYSASDPNAGTLITFTTNCGNTPQPTDPTVATDAASNIAQTTATLNGTVTNPDNVTITAMGFEWKTTTGGTFTPVTVTGNTLTYDLSNLTANTGYTYKAFITFNGTTVYGNEVNFTTLQETQLTDPTVATVAASAIEQTTATLNATITNPDNVTITAKGFEWKATAGGTYTQIAGTGTGNTFTANLSGLTANTGYTYKAFITFNGTTVYGEEMTFTTLPEEVQPCNVPTNLHTTAVEHEVISIAWDADANVTSWNIQYRPVGGDLATATTNTNSYTITGLTGLTTYEIQVQANCGDGNLSDWTAAITPQTTNVGIENHLLNSIKLYPNPANDVVNVQCTMYNVQSVEVIDVYGKVIKTMNVTENPTRINVSGLANGMYFVRVTTEEGTVTKTFVKK